MPKIKRYWVLPALVAIGMAVPTGVSNQFLPSILVSSGLDMVSVYVPVISFQTLLLLFYCLCHLRLIVLTALQLVMACLLCFITLFCSYFSLSPWGFLSYSAMWLIAPFAVAIHYKIMQDKGVEPFATTAGLVAYMFLPFYVVDFLVSTYAFGWEEFTSYTLASNGHTFVSMLMVLFIQFDIISRSERFSVVSFKGVAFMVYLMGGIISEGRVALICMLLVSILINWRRAKMVLPVAIFGFWSLIYFNEKVRVVYDALSGADFEDQVVWSSLISRLNFWDVFYDIFEDNPFAGAGGLYSNIVKYNYYFPYYEFVDPHNELIFIVSGFGLCGIAFIIMAVIFSRSLRVRQLHIFSVQESRVNRTATHAALWFILACSLTNANSAKQNIELVFCLTILFSASGSIKHPSQRVASTASE